MGITQVIIKKWFRYKACTHQDRINNRIISPNLPMTQPSLRAGGGRKRGSGRVGRKWEERRKWKF